MFNLILQYLDLICAIIAALSAIFLQAIPAKYRSERIKELDDENAQWVRYLRTEILDLTQEKFAELLNVEPRTVQRWESGDRRPRQQHVAQMRRLSSTITQSTIPEGGTDGTR